MPMPRTVAEIVAEADKLAKQFEDQEIGSGDMKDATALRELRYSLRDLLYLAKLDLTRRLSDPSVAPS